MTSKIHLPWVFDDTPLPDPHGRADRAVGFINALRHHKAPGGRFVLPHFWERIIRAIYGPSDEYGNRQTRVAYIQLPRGARKTTIGSALGLLHSSGHERINGGSCILAATAEDQAALAFNEAKSFVNATPLLRKASRLVESELEIEHLKSGSILRAIPAEGDVQQGQTPYFVLIDELHVWKNRRLWRALKTGLLKIPNTLMVIITTAGRGQDNLGFEEYSYAKRIASGEIHHPSYLPIIFEPPAIYDWRDEKVWHAVNPGLRHGFPDLVGMRQAAIEAQEKPADRDDFCQYNLNQWLDHATSPFVEMSVFDEGDGAVDLDTLKGQPCWLGVDLSSTRDLTVIVAAWRDGEGGYIVHPWFFCPKMNLRERENKSGASYVEWHSKGLITATDGNVVDYDAVEAKIRELCSKFGVREIAFDPALARSVLNNLQKDGLPAVEMRQGALTMMPAIAELERAIVGRKLRHGGHPVLRFCFSNVEVERNKQQHAVRFKKSKAWLSIDGAVAAAMAVGRASNGEDHRSWLDDPNLKIEDLVLT